MDRVFFCGGGGGRCGSFSRYHMNLVFNNMCWIFDSISNVFILALHYLFISEETLGEY